MQPSSEFVGGGTRSEFACSSGERRSLTGSTIPADARRRQTGTIVRTARKSLQFDAMSRDTSTTANASVRSEPGLGRRSPGGGPGPASRVRSDCVHGRPESIWHVSERSTQLSSELASSRRDPQDRPSASSTSARLPAPPKNPGPEPQSRAPTRSPVRSPLGGTRHDQSHATKPHQDHDFPNMIQDRRARQCCGVPAPSCAANNRRWGGLSQALPEIAPRLRDRQNRALWAIMAPRRAGRAHPADRRPGS